MFGFTCSLLFPCSFPCRNWELTAPWTGAQIKVPTKFIAGDLDLSYNTVGTQDYVHKGGFKRDVPLLEEVIELKNVGHFLPEEKPDEINKHIYDFFQKFWLAFWPPSCRVYEHLVFFLLPWLELCGYAYECPYFVIISLLSGVWHVLQFAISIFQCKRVCFDVFPWTISALLTCISKLWFAWCWNS